MNHERFIHHCITLAKKGRGLGGNPSLVGSVLVRDEEIIAEGWYKGEGAMHAERDLLSSYTLAIQPEDILYVNLEPCCHHGSTPPCTDIIIERGIQTVVVGMKDPDSRVAGKGVETLREAGIKVMGPVLPELCRRLNKGFVSLRENGRPYITLKRAQTKTGITANSDGTKLCITSDEQNEWSHTHLRATHDAILVGVQTVITDDPMLTIRSGKWEVKSGKSQPWRIILDPHLRIPINAKVIGERCIIIKDAQESKDAKEEKLKEKGVQVVSVPMINTQFNLPNFFSQSSIFNLQYSISSILVEGGPKTWDAFTAAGIIDEEVVLVGCV